MRRTAIQALLQIGIAQRWIQRPRQPTRQKALDHALYRRAHHTQTARNQALAESLIKM